MKILLIIIFTLALCSCGSQQRDQTIANNDIQFGTPDFAIMDYENSDHAIIIYPNKIYEGSLVAYEFTVKNIGNNYNGKKYIVEVITDGPIGQPPFGGHEMESANPENEIYLTNSIKRFSGFFRVGPSGVYSLIIRIDKDNLINELNKENNTKTIDFTVEQYVDGS